MSIRVDDVFYGVQFTGGMFEHGPVKFAVLEDPNGNVLQIYQCVR